MSRVALSAAIVTYRTESAVLERSLRSLAAAIRDAHGKGLVSTASVYIVDNSPAADSTRVAASLAAWPAAAGSIALVAGHGNLGYGRANNLVLRELRSDQHLVMNPDVELAPDALAAAIAALAEHPEVGLIAPATYGDDGALQYLCKRYPSLWVLYLRGFAPQRLRRRFRRTIEDYEMRDVIDDRFVSGVTLASGCFMLVRTALFAKLGGFDPRFFMYFEDYDLSLRLGREARIAYLPSARIVHHGGEASSKGWRHVVWFMRSAWRFFSRHGWKVA